MKEEDFSISPAYSTDVCTTDWPGQSKIPHLAGPEQTVEEIMARNVISVRLGRSGRGGPALQRYDLVSLRSSTMKSGSSAIRPSTT